jgi:hypothetical protein
MVPVVSLGHEKSQKAISIIQRFNPQESTNVVRDDSRQAAPIPDLVPFV